MRKSTLFPLAIMLTGIGLLLALTSPVLAHEDRPVGPYQLHVGWEVEPALVGQLNAVELTVTQNGQPVKDVEKTLFVTLFTGGKTSDKMQFTPSDETPGLYTSAVIPTRVGDYKFHFAGTIGETKVDETFDSGDGKIDSVEPVTDLQFPEKDPSLSDLQQQITDLKAQIAALKGNTTSK